jgi:hypothetical protein
LHHDNAPSHTSFSPRNIWPKTTWLSPPTHPTRLTWPPATFLCFPEAQKRWEPCILVQGDYFEGMVASRPKVSFWPDGNTSPANYGYL